MLFPGGCNEVHAAEAQDDAGHVGGHDVHEAHGRGLHHPAHHHRVELLRAPRREAEHSRDLVVEPHLTGSYSYAISGV